MGQTFAEKILAKKAGLASTSPGEIVEISPDVALSHDNTAPILGIFRKMGGVRVHDPEIHAIFLDHAAPAPTTKHAENHRIIREFVGKQGIPHFFDVGRGICHQVLVEEGLALPGEIVLGSDSHTPHAGVMGAFGAGIGRSEMASIWALGSLWLRVPESLQITVRNGIAGSSMPAFPLLTEQEISDVSSYIKSLREGGWDQPDPIQAAPNTVMYEGETGEELFVSAACNSCHQLDAVGAIGRVEFHIMLRC